MILITGATGNVGRYIASQLLDQGEKVRVFVRDKSKIRDHRAEIAIGDLNEPETIVQALDGVEKAFAVFLDMGTSQVENFVRSAQKTGLRQIVKLSTSHAGEAKTKIGQWHQAKEEVVRNSGTPFSFLRPGKFMSNDLQWAGTVKNQGAVYFPGGNYKLAPIHPRDIAAVAVACLTETGHEGQIYQLTGPELLSTADEVQILSEVLGKSIKHVDITAEALGAEMKKHGVPEQVAEAVTETYQELEQNPSRTLTKTVEQITGRPASSFRTWCQENIAAFKG